MHCLDSQTSKNVLNALQSLTMASTTENYLLILHLTLIYSTLWLALEAVFGSSKDCCSESKVKKVKSMFED